MLGNFDNALSSAFSKPSSRSKSSTNESNISPYTHPQYHFSRPPSLAVSSLSRMKLPSEKAEKQRSEQPEGREDKSKSQYTHFPSVRKTTPRFSGLKWRPAKIGLERSMICAGWGLLNGLKRTQRRLRSSPCKCATCVLSGYYYFTGRFFNLQFNRVATAVTAYSVQL